MPDPTCIRSPRCGLALTLGAALLAVSAFDGAAPLAQDEVRALWVVRTTLTSPAAIDTMVKTAATAGFNTLLVQVRGRADSYYAGGTEPRPSLLAAQPSFDPLAETVARAQAAGLQVHAWVNVNLIAGAGELPTARDHVIYRHPEWLMVPRALVDDLADVPARSPEYVGRLARYVRSQSSEVEGLYLSPIAPAAVEYTSSVVRDIVERYPVNGIHLDYVRYPREDFDYSRDALAAFRRNVADDLTLDDRSKYDARLAAEPLVYTEAFPERWREFRANQLTRLVASVRQAVKSARPAALLSAAVVPDPNEASTRRFQDWRGWLERGLIDVVCPMAYTTDADLFASQVAAARAIAGPRPLWAGIGAYRLSPPQIVANVRTARRLGVGGIILFSYDSLTDPTRGTDYLSEVGRAAFMP